MIKKPPIHVLICENVKEVQRQTSAALAPITWKNKVLASLATMAVVKFQLRRLSQGRATQPKVSPLWAFALQQWMMFR